MPDFDLDAALTPQPEWEPWDVWQRIDRAHRPNLDTAWVSRSSRYWTKSDGTALAKADARHILDLDRTGHIEVIVLTVPKHAPNAALLLAVADGYNRYPHEIDELSIQEQWMMVWAYHGHLPSRIKLFNFSADEFRRAFPTNA